MGVSPKNQQLALVALVQVLGLSVWFSATAVVPSLRDEWHLSSTAATWLTASVQIGFVVGALTSTVLNLADRIRPQWIMAAAALGSAACTVAFATCASGLGTAVPLRFATGVFLAGIYPVGMKLTASWSTPVQRGRSFGVLLGALTLGSALPHLIGGLGPLPWRSIMAAAAGLGLVAAVVAVTAVRAGPHLDTRPFTPNARYAVAMFAQRGPRLANLGYFGHMWELYALWTWLAVFVMMGGQARGWTWARRPESSRSQRSVWRASWAVSWVAGRRIGSVDHPRRSRHWPSVGPAACSRRCSSPRLPGCWWSSCSSGVHRSSRTQGCSPPRSAKPSTPVMSVRR